jgi:hypothetical protein
MTKNVTADFFQRQEEKKQLEVWRNQLGYVSSERSPEEKTIDRLFFHRPKTLTDRKTRLKRQHKCTRTGLSLKVCRCSECSK